MAYPVRTVFEVTYAPWACGNGATIAETRRVSLDAGSHLTRFESRFALTGTNGVAGGPDLDVSAQHLHNGVLAANPEQGWLTNAEPEQKGKGSIATALVLPQSGTLTSDGQGNAYLLDTLTADKPFVWYAGAAWSGAGDFVSPEYWNRYYAGIIRREPFVEHSAKNWNDVIGINLSTPFFLSQAAAKQMIAQDRRGKIIHIASMLSFQGGILVPGYAASKGGIKSLTMLMANELAPHNICTNAIAPGYIATENTRPIRENPARNQAILDRIPAGRWGTPEDLMSAVVFLASPASDYMNGHVLVVDGGWLAR